MDSSFLLMGLLWFIAFLFSTTCHEAAHAWVAKKGGDLTAYAGGQVSLDPIPHIRREPFGMVIMPLLSYYSGGWMMGWASAPYDRMWARTYPRRAAWMALAGPVANFAIVIGSGLLIQMGRIAGVFQLSGRTGFEEIVKAPADGPAAAAAALLSVLYSLNLLLGSFNLLPIPPLDGFGVLGLLLPESAMQKLMDFRDSLGMLMILGLLLAWRAFDVIFEPVYITGLKILYMVHL
jgi:Zn-dependent protease